MNTNKVGRKEHETIVRISLSTLSVLLDEVRIRSIGCGEMRTAVQMLPYICVDVAFKN